MFVARHKVSVARFGAGTNPTKGLALGGAGNVPSARRQPRTDAARARAWRLVEHGRRDDVAARANELLDGDDDGVGDPRGKGGVHDRAPPAGLGYGRRSRTGVPKRLTNCRPLAGPPRLPPLPPVATVRVRPQSVVCHRGMRQTPLVGADDEVSSRDALASSKPRVNRDGPLGGDGDVRYRFAPLG